MGIANKLAGMMMGLFILGAIGATAINMVANDTAYEAGVPAPVVTVFTVLVPVMAGIAVALYFLPRRS